MSSYYISWHMKQAPAPILFCDNDKRRGGESALRRRGRAL